MRLRWIIGGVVSCSVLLAAYVAFYDRVSVVRLDAIFSPSYGYPADLRERYFEQKFPSHEDIERYLTNLTILKSDPPVNEVYYFDDGKYLLWRGQSIESGKWRSTSDIQLITLRGKWRVAVVQTFCLFADSNSDRLLDNCVSVGSLDSILSGGRSVHKEIREGDVFELAKNKISPQRLPSAAITIDVLMSTLSISKRN